MGQAYFKEPCDQPPKGRHENSLKGFAKRAANYDDVAENGAEYSGYPLSRLDLMRAATIGTPELSDATRSLLAVYLCHLDTRRLGEGHTCVWPGNECVGQALGKKDPTIRRLKGDLEKAGFILRNYDRRNRPLEGGAIDLSPFLNAAPGILREIEAKSDARKRAWADSRKIDQPRVRSNQSGVPLTSERQNSTLKSTDSCLGLLGFEGNQAAKPSINTSSITGTKHSAKDQEIINQALKLSSRLKSALDPEGKGLSPTEAVNHIWSALPTLFPNDGANSLSHTFLWCAKRHGAKAFLYLAVALEDPTAKSPQKLFGWFATHTEKIDIRRNLERIKHRPKPVQPKDDKPRLPGAAFENEIGAVIAKEMGAPAYNSWFNPASIRFVVKTDKLIIEHASPIARQYLVERHGTQLRLATEALGFNGFVVKDLE